MLSILLWKKVSSAMAAARDAADRSGDGARRARTEQDSGRRCRQAGQWVQTERGRQAECEEQSAVPMRRRAAAKSPRRCGEGHHVARLQLSDGANPKQHCSASSASAPCHLLAIPTASASQRARAGCSSSFSRPCPRNALLAAAALSLPPRSLHGLRLTSTTNIASFHCRTLCYLSVCSMADDDRPLSAGLSSTSRDSQTNLAAAGQQGAGSTPGESVRRRAPATPAQGATYGAWLLCPPYRAVLKLQPPSRTLPNGTRSPRSRPSGAEPRRPTSPTRARSFPSTMPRTRWTRTCPSRRKPSLLR